MEGGKDPRLEVSRAVDHAIGGDWEAAHAIAQAHEGHEGADWLHAVLHKIEGDTANARYWYRRTKHTFEDFVDPQAELISLKVSLIG